MNVLYVRRNRSSPNQLQRNQKARISLGITSRIAPHRRRHRATYLNLLVLCCFQLDRIDRDDGDRLEAIDLDRMVLHSHGEGIASVIGTVLFTRSDGQQTRRR